MRHLQVLRVGVNDKAIVTRDLLLRDQSLKNSN